MGTPKPIITGSARLFRSLTPVSPKAPGRYFLNTKPSQRECLDSRKERKMKQENRDSLVRTPVSGLAGRTGIQHAWGLSTAPLPGGGNKGPTSSQESSMAGHEVVDYTGRGHFGRVDAEILWYARRQPCVQPQEKCGLHLYERFQRGGGAAGSPTTSHMSSG